MEKKGGKKKEKKKKKNRKKNEKKGRQKRENQGEKNAERPRNTVQLPAPELSAESRSSSSTRQLA